LIYFVFIIDDICLLNSWHLWPDQFRLLSHMLASAWGGFAGFPTVNLVFWSVFTHRVNSGREPAQHSYVIAPILLWDKNCWIGLAALFDILLRGVS
jgi:hypothetical protein